MIARVLENGRLTALFIILLIVAGLGSLNTMPRAEDPRITTRVASVITHFPGASAERVEALISEKIENKLRKLADIKRLTSTSRPGISVVKVELLDRITEPTPVWSRVRDLLADVAPLLPKGSGEPSLDDDHGYAFTTLISLTWQGPGADQTVVGRYAEELQNRLRIVSGTDFVELFGDPDEEILVNFDPAILGRLQLSANDIAARLGQADAKVSAGQLINSSNQLQVELTGALDSVQRIRNIPILNDKDGFLLRLGDIADVSRQPRWPASEIALINDQHAVVVAARMQSALRVDQWTQAVHQAIDRFRPELPSHIELEILFDQNRYTETRLSELMENILVGFSIIAVVLLVTLGWRSALIVSASLPLTVLFTLTCMNYFGLPIHQMSVTGLVVALGIMVDNAIVMADSIQQRRLAGDSSQRAITFSIRHLWLPLLGSTLTTILAFMPIILMPGAAGEFVGGIALSVIFALIGSYLISHTLVAALAGRFIKVTDGDTRWYRNGIRLPAIQRLFHHSLKLALRNPVITVLLVFMLPASGFMAAKQLTEQFFPPSDRDMFQIELYLPAQASILDTEQTSRDLYQYLKKQDGIEQVRWFIGNNAPSFYYNLVPNQRGAQNYAQAMVTARDFNTANRLIPQLQVQLDEQFPKAQILVRKLEQGPPFNAPIELRLYGPNLDTLKQLGDEARRILSLAPHLLHTRATLQPGTPKVWVNMDEDASQLSGLTLTGMASQLEAALQGSVQGSVLEATESIPVRIRLANEQRQQLSDLADLNLSVRESSRNVPLSALGELEIKPSRGAIPRRNGERVNVIEGYVEAGVLPGKVLTEFKQLLQDEEFSLPTGYRMEFGGESAERNNAVAKLLASVGVIVALLVTVVVLSFNSFRISTLIFLSAFQSVGLGLLCVYLFDYPFGFTVIIALMGLMGLAINAAIVILAELKADPAAVDGDPAAIRQCVSSCARHISSTTITTVGGFMPLILAGGGFWPPFAIAIAGGTVLTTLLSFYFVPTAFLLLSRRKSFERTTAMA